MITDESIAGFKPCSCAYCC